MHTMVCKAFRLHRSKICLLQIDEFIKTGTLAALHEVQASAEGGDAPQKKQAVESKAQDMASKFL